LDQLRRFAGARRTGIAAQEIKKSHPNAELLTMGIPAQRTVVSHLISLPDPNGSEPTFHEVVCHSEKVAGWQCLVAPKSEIYKLPATDIPSKGP
jgi:hypothetical protein